MGKSWPHTAASNYLCLFVHLTFQSVVLQ